MTTILVKAGPGTIAEAMIRGLPIILNDYIAGQVMMVLNDDVCFWSLENLVNGNFLWL